MDKQDLAPVSVVIPCYRCADTIGRAVASIAAQTTRPAEVILVDDWSGDETPDRLHALKHEHPDGWIQVIALPENGGPGTARNAGWEQATQPYIAFLDADDAWHPQKIEIQYGWMSAHPEAALSGHACRQVKGVGDEQVGSRLVPGEVAFRPVSPRQLLLSNRFSTPSVMLKRSLPHRFLPGKRHSEDFLVWCELCLDGHPCYSSDAPLALLYKAAFGEGGLSGNLGKMQNGEMDAYRRLRDSGRINRLAMVFLLFWSVAKYVRRVIITILRKQSSV
jgi:glycosyltransferase involved in cell wall biosynthesis